MKKKFLCLLTSLILPFSSSLHVASDNTVNNNNTTEITLSGKLKSEKKETYKVDVEWGSMEFTYTPIWSPENHKYISHDDAWSCEEGANKVTVTNHSSAKVTVNVTYTSIENPTGEVELDPPTELNAATELKEATKSGAANLTATLKLKNELTDTAANNKTVGTVTVTISD